MKSILFVALTVACICGASAVQKNWTNLYSGWPQPTQIRKYVAGAELFTCKGRFALGSYASCVLIPGSTPPMAECGCYSFRDVSLGTSTAVLKKRIGQDTKSFCYKKSKEVEKDYCVNNVNSAPFCKRMNSGTFFPERYPLVSTYNPTDWQDATGEGGAMQPCLRGGTLAICYTAACVDRPPSSPFLPNTNATCYCPIYNVRPGSLFFVASNATGACGPKKLENLKPNRIIYNGA